MKRKIRQSEQTIAAYEKQTTRPRATDHQSLNNVRWSSWNARGSDPQQWLMVKAPFAGMAL